MAEISEGRWRQLETGVQKVRGQEIEIGTKPATVAAVARVVNWDVDDALQTAGFDVDDLERVTVAEDQEPPWQEWRELSPRQREAVRELLRSMVEPAPAVPPAGQVEVARSQKGSDVEVVRGGDSRELRR